MIRFSHILIEGIRKLLSIFVLVSFATVVTLAVLGSLFTEKLTQSQIWIDNLDSTEIAAQSRIFFTKLLVNSYISGNEQFIGKISQGENWENVAQAMIPSDWVGQSIKMLIESTMGWLLSPTDSIPDLAIDLIPIKNNLRSHQAAVAAIPFFEDIEVCQEGDNQVVFMRGSLVNCRPSDWDVVYLTDYVLNMIADTLPDQASVHSLATTGLMDSQIFQTAYQIKGRFNVWQESLRLSTRIAIVLICLYGLLNLKSNTYLIKKLAIPFIMAGLFILLLLAVWYALMRWGLRILIPIIGSQLSLEMQSVLIDFARSIGDLLQVKWLIWGFGMLLAGVLIRISGALFTRYLQRREIAKKKLTKEVTRVRKQFY